MGGRRLEDPGGVEPLAHGLKARCPTVSGLNAPGPSVMHAAASRPGLMRMVMVFSYLIDVSGSPARYRTAVFRLSAGRSAFELREKIAVSSELAHPLPGTRGARVTPVGGAPGAARECPADGSVVLAPGLEPGCVGV